MSEPRWCYDESECTNPSEPDCIKCMLEDQDIQTCNNPKYQRHRGSEG